MKDTVVATIFLGDNKGWSKIGRKYVHRIITIDGGIIKYYKNGILQWKNKL
mgnify:CR=1 FL=1